MKPIFNRGPYLPLRLFLAIFASIVLLIVDSKISSFGKIRTYMNAAVSPFYLLTNTPRTLLDNIFQTFASRQQLEVEVSMLKQELLIKSSDLQLLEHLRQENSRLRVLLGSPLQQDEKKMVTQVISSDITPYSSQIVINKGTHHDVYKGQPVINNRGVIGQVIIANKFTSHILLICAPEHALPIQILRNDIRVIANGTGCNEMLVLNDLPSTADVRVGDILITSGLGGRFPEGYPVAVVSSVKINSQRARAIVHARPIADLQRLRYLLLLWGANNSNNRSLPPDTVNKIAQERLQQMTPGLPSVVAHFNNNINTANTVSE